MKHREELQKQYQAGRSNLLIALVLTVINIVMLFAGGETMMLFSISLPYYLVIFGGLLESVTLLLAALILLVVYFLLWLLSKKRPAFMVAALVCMVLDTAMLTLLYLTAEDFTGILDVLFHVWIVYYLFAAVRANSKLKALPPEPEAEPQQPDNSTPLRRIEEGEKSRLLLQVEWEGYRVCYRRVKRINQLVINDYVYDEVAFLVEPPHELNATVNGHRFAVGYNGNSVYFNFDGEKIKSKIRWF